MSTYKTIVKVFGTYYSMRKAYVRDYRLFETLGILSKGLISPSELETEYGVIKYYYKDTLDKIINLTIIDESFEGVSEWKYEHLAPGSSKDGKIVY